MAHQNEHDLRCIFGVRNGDRRAIEELYDRHTPFIYSVALRILKDPREAEDAVQETWVQVWKTASRFDPRRGSVAAWVLTIARTRSLDKYRSLSTRRRLEPQGEAVATEPPQDASAPALHRELNDRVMGAFEQLTEQQRTVLTKAYFGGKTQREIADEMDAPLGTVKSWTRQGLMRLKAILPKGDLT